MPPRSAPGDAPADSADQVARAAAILRDGGVIAYPTESVYGLGCLPENERAVERILALKDRQRSLGVILIAAEWEQFDGWANALAAEPKSRELLRSRGVTWIVSADPKVPDWITGAHATIAIRRSLHPLAAELSRAADSPLVSTSCNPHGQAPARNAKHARDYFGSGVDWILDGQCGPLDGPTEIRNATTGEVLRSG
ncbi:L-threonylcarbamoyladenylate synthase [Candidatus Foliamicus sp.]